MTALEQQRRRGAYARKYGVSERATEYEIRAELDRRRYQWIRNNPGKGFYDGAKEKSELAGTAGAREEHHRQVRAERGMFDPQTGELDTETPVEIYDVEKHQREIEQMMVAMDNTRLNYPPSFVRIKMHPDSPPIKNTAHAANNYRWKKWRE